MAEHAGGNAPESRRKPEGRATSCMLHMKALFRPGFAGQTTIGACAERDGGPIEVHLLLIWLDDQ